MTYRTVIYFVTTIRLNGDKRTVGYYFNFHDAQATIEGNHGDIYEEGYYQYALIEHMGSGLYPAPAQSETWYKWEGLRYSQPDANGSYSYGDDAGYKTCDKPEKFARFVGWAIG